MNGFQRFVRTGIRVELNRNTKVDVRLKLGTLAEQIEVTDAAPTVETRRINDLRLNGRNVYDLALTLPASPPPAPTLSWTTTATPLTSTAIASAWQYISTQWEAPLERGPDCGVERKTGQQALNTDFLIGCLQRIGARRTPQTSTENPPSVP